ncbi:hypothetical protein CBL_01736 [Carabus blaptoides fortunei]
MKFMIVIFAFAAVSFAEKTNKDKRGVLSLGYGHGLAAAPLSFGHGLSGPLSYGHALAAPISLPVASVGYGHTDLGLGNGGLALGHSGIALGHSGIALSPRQLLLPSLLSPMLHL